ncbi:MAG: TetR/AcrR family transcriptional regulator [bacterium]|nr:TetR/AcrR family transcriptional regulator [bacterium]
MPASKNKSTTSKPLSQATNSSNVAEMRESFNRTILPPDNNTPRGQIFLAATRLFAENGFKGTNTRAIAQAANVKQVMIHYYFGSKEQLYETVLRFEGMTMLLVIFDETLENKSSEEMLIDSTIRLMTVLHDNPLWSLLLRREIADGAAHLRRALREVNTHGPLGGNHHFHDTYLEAVKTGKAVDLPIEAVRECLLAIGYSAIYLAPLISVINERDIHDETVWEEWKLTLCTILKRGLLTNKG